MIIKVLLEYLETGYKGYNNSLEFKLSDGLFYYMNNNERRELYILSLIV